MANPNETAAEAVTRLKAEIARVEKQPANEQTNLQNLRDQLARAERRVADGE